MVGLDRDQLLDIFLTGLADRLAMGGYALAATATGDSPALAAADAELEAPASDANLSPLLAAMMLTLADTIAANNAAIASALEFRDRLAVKRLPFDALIRPLSARSGRV